LTHYTESTLIHLGFIISWMNEEYLGCPVCSFPLLYLFTIGHEVESPLQTYLHSSDGAIILHPTWSKLSLHHLASSSVRSPLL